MRVPHYSRKEGRLLKIGGNTAKSRLEYVNREESTGDPGGFEIIELRTGRNNSTYMISAHSYFFRMLGNAALKKFLNILYTLHLPQSQLDITLAFL